MSAEVLRDAARLMRERAEVATPGPWECLGDHLVWPSEKGPAANDPIAGFGPAHEDTAPHIASWHPAVALAVADWLDHEATYIEHVEKARVDVPYIRDVPAARRDRSLAVARAYLGSDQ